MLRFKYKAFISYSHADHKSARWLHRRLETYNIPKHLRGSDKKHHLKPIFRDREDLPASHSLGSKIEQALEDSECLIVMCSPRAAQSEWVNQEVLSYKRYVQKSGGKAAKIFCVIIEGEPFSGGADECMPPALRFELGAEGELSQSPAEPLAADLRSGRDGKRLGMLKLISGMLDVGLDELVQRDLQRNRIRVMVITGVASAIVLAMGTLTTFAVSASKRADAARVESEARKNDAEGLIEFMLTELKPELESVGRLEPLSLVGERAAKYYADQTLESHNDNALGRRARVFHYIGEIEGKYGNLNKAEQRFADAYASTKELLARTPNNPDRIFDHAQSAYWVGHIPYERGDYAVAKPYYLEYVKLAEKLEQVEPESLRSLEELSYAYTNLGTLNFRLKQVDDAYDWFQSAQKVKQNLVARDPKNLRRRLNLANGYAWLADAALYGETLTNALTHRRSAFDIFEKLRRENPENTKVQRKSLQNNQALARLILQSGDLGEAQNLVGDSIAMAERVFQRDPSNTDGAHPLISLNLLGAEIDIMSKRYTEAEKKLSRALQVESALPPKLFKGDISFQQNYAERKLLAVHLQIAKSDLGDVRSAFSALKKEFAEVEGDKSEGFGVRSLQFLLMDYLISEDCQSLVEIQGFLEKPGKVLALGSRADLFGALSNEALPEYVKAQFEWDKYAKTVKLNIFENTAARLSQSRPQRNCVANVIPKRP